MTGAALLAAVFAFNLACLPLWLVVSALRRQHDQGVRRLEVFLALTEARERSPELTAQLEFARRSLEQARHLGALWGRRHVSSGLLWIGHLQQQHQDELDDVIRAMSRP